MTSDFKSLFQSQQCGLTNRSPVPETAAIITKTNLVSLRFTFIIIIFCHRNITPIDYVSLKNTLLTKLY